MEQRTGSQYDDDLTIGVEDFGSDAIDTDYVDLFEFSGGEESPISRLKTIMLEIDWEITDEVLIQFNEELIDLKDIWSDEPIKLVYVQALEKISKYIFQKKADAHPSAIRLLMSFYYNLEKIDIDTKLSEDEKKTLLKGDIQKFEKLKKHISPSSASSSAVKAPKAAVLPVVAVNEQGSVDPSLFNLKACILGMDWEITDRELSHLSREVRRLEQEFSGYKARLLFLQGIAALGGYIKLKKSDSHADAFKILYAFFEGLEKIVSNKLSPEEEKAILFAEVAKFNHFKQVIAPTITPEAISDQNLNDDDAVYSSSVDNVPPAFAGMEDEDGHGFQAEEEIADLKGDSPDDVLDRLDSFFTGNEEVEGTAGAPSTGLTEPDSSAHAVSTEDALRGVEVETDADDDSDEDALPTVAGGVLAPALAGAEDEAHGFSAELIAEAIKAESDGVTTDEIEDRLSGFFEEEPVPDRRQTGTVAALEGVAAETDGDDDSAEEDLPIEEEGFLGPALSDFAEEGSVSDGHDNRKPIDELEGMSAESIEDRLSGFFDDEPTPALQDEPDSLLSPTEVDEKIAPVSPETDRSIAPVAGVDVETEADDDSDLAALPTETDGVIAPALSDTDEEAELSAFADGGFLTDDGGAIADLEERLSQFFDAEPGTESEAEKEEDVESLITEAEGEEDGESLITEAEAEDDVENLSVEIDRLLDETAFSPELTGETDTTDDDEFFVDMPAGADKDSAEDLFALQEEADTEPGESDEAPVTLGFASEMEEDVVIFEAADHREEDHLAIENLPVATIIPEEESDTLKKETTFYTFDSEADEKEFFAEIDDKVDEPGEFTQEILEEVDELEPETLKLPGEGAADEAFQFDEEIDEMLVGGRQQTPDQDQDETVSIDDSFSSTGDDPLSDLRTSIASLGIEISEQITGGVLSAVNGLRHRFMSRPAEKTLLQLISTIVQHIGQYGYESSAESHGLLLSVFDKLEQIQVPETDSVQAQEIVLAETCTVLLWQQNMLERQAIRKGGRLTFLDPLRAEAQSQDFSKRSEEEDGEVRNVLPAADSVDFDNEFSAEFDPVDNAAAQEEMKLDPVAVLLESDTSVDPAVADFIKIEIASLTESLRAEIAELRNRLLDRE